MKNSNLIFLLSILGLSGLTSCIYHDYSDSDIRIGGTRTPPAKTEDELRYHTILNGAYQFNCAIVEAGKVKCWGENANGQLGDGATYVSSVVPVYVQGITNAVSLAGGDYGACALLATGKVKCWGRNAVNELGIGDPLITKSHTALEVPGLADVVGIDSSDNHYCALLKSRTIKCWGDNGYGQLGDGTANASTALVDVVGVDSVRSFGIGSSTTCAVMYSGKVKCWGLNRYGGASGSGVAGWQWFTPTDIPNIENAISVTGSQYTMCALLADQSVSCWGRTYAGVLNSVAYDLPNFHGALKISGGFSHLCALMPDSKVSCVGYNGDGRLGDGTFISKNDPVEVTSLPAGEITEVRLGDEFSCIRLADASMWCWGNNGLSALGDQTVTNRNTPVEVIGL